MRPSVPIVGGLVWTVAVVGAAVAAPALLAVVVIPVAVVATASGLRAAAAGRRRSRSGRTASVAVPVVLAVVAPMAALAGPAVGVAVLVLVGLVAAGAAAVPAMGSSVRPVRASVRSAGAAVMPAVAATSLVIARHQGATLVLALLAAVAAYDAGAFVMGHGRSPLGGPVGIASGIAGVAVVAVFVAAVMDPPFSGSRPWVVMGLVALLAPAGVWLAGALTGPGRLPAVRRLDSLILTAPVWALAVAVQLHR